MNLRKFFAGLVILFLLSFGLALAADVVLVLSGHYIPRNYPTLGMSWHDSPIFHYNVNPASNALIGMMAFFALFTGTMVASTVLFAKPDYSHLNN